MKTKNLQELKTNSVQKLKIVIAGFEQEIAKTNLDNQKNQTKNVHIIRQKRKDIAKAMTILAQKMFEEKSKGVTDAAK